MSSTEDAPLAPASFRLAYVAGVTPGKWTRIWSERVPDVPLDLVTADGPDAVGVLRDGRADAALVRLPIDRAGLHAIPLYTETTVVVVPKDHEIAAVDEASVADLAEYLVLHPLDDSLEWEQLPGRPAKERPATTADAVELVAAGVGLLVVPQSLARLHHRRDLTYRTLIGAPQSSVALAWPEERTTDLMEEFIGIVRGRTVNSSRGRSQAQAGTAASASKPDKRGAAGGAAGRKKPAAASARTSGKPRRRR